MKELISKISDKRTFSDQNCNCMYIPEHIIDHLAASGVKNAPLTSQQDKISREKRAARVNSMAEFASLTPVGRAGKTVYDCQHTWVQRVKQVRKEGGPLTGDDSADNAYDFAGDVKEYYKTGLNRDSIDNASMDIILNVHYGDHYMNAFWDGDEMTFGDGDGTIFIDFAKSLDVVAHELTHGVTQWEAGLVYNGQSGALNESFSDVFGSVITQYVNKETADTADWLIGDEIMGPTLKGEALRSMSEPGTAYNNPLLGKDPQPNHMDRYVVTTSDNGGVHINSGIPNKAFYLASKAIGTDKAALAWYTGLQNLWPTAKFNDAVAVIARAAGLLESHGQLPPGSPQKIRAAFLAVGLPK